MTVLLLILKFKLWKFIEKDKLLMGWLVRTIFLKYKVMFDNNFCFLFLETCFWEYKEKKKTIFLYFWNKKHVYHTPLSCQTSFFVSKIENCFWKQKIRGKNSYQTYPKIPIIKFDLKFQLRKLLNESLICESVISKI